MQILLKGASSDELKKIKCVVRCAVVMAYHLILETSFLVDQRAMFSTISAANTAADVLPSDEKSHNSVSSDLSIPSPKYVSAENEPDSTEIPIQNASHEENTDNSSLEPEEFSPISREPYNPAVFSSFSAISSSLKKVLGDSFPFPSSAPYQSLSAYLGLSEREHDGQINKSLSLLDKQETNENCGIESRCSSDEEKSFNAAPACLESSHDKSKESDDDRSQSQSKGDINAVLDSQSILVLMSSRNALRGTICQQSHFSHIMFYKNFDVPLGKFLQDNLLNQVFITYFFCFVLFGFSF